MVDKEIVLDKLKNVVDPEIQFNIVDLGLIYDVKFDKGMVIVDMTLTSPMCPVGPQIINDVENNIKELDGVTGVSVNIVWEPAWSPEQMSEEARLALNL